jgi:hypothetical protein
MNARFQELESILKRQQKAIAASGQKAADRLSTLERQFSRIEDLDTKMATVQMAVDTAVQQMTHTASNQKQMSTEIQTMKNETNQQFSEIQGKVLTTLESQHSMSQTMLDMREQFDKISTFMIDMAAKLEMAMKGQQGQISEELTLSQQRVMKRSQQSSSSQSTSSHSKMSHDSSQDSSIYKSPEKKKHRPREFPRKAQQANTLNTQMTATSTGVTNKTHQNDNQADILNHYGKDYEAEYDPEHMSDASDVCLNLEDAFNHTQQQDKKSYMSSDLRLSKETNRQNDAIERGTQSDTETVNTQPDAPANHLIINLHHPRSKDHAISLGNTRTRAPLNHQYIDQNDSVGANTK